MAVTRAQLGRSAMSGTDTLARTEPPNDRRDRAASDGGRSAASETRSARYVILSGYHDYRSKRRANLHFIADELAKRGEVFFLSLRYSHLTRRREDPRHDLWHRANRVERVNGVECYLWRTPLPQAHLVLVSRP